MINTTAPTVRLHVYSSVVSRAVEQYVSSVCKKCGNFRVLSRGFVKDGERFRLDIKFENAVASRKARELLHNSNVPGFPSISPLKATYSEMTKNLWIGNMHRNVTERMLLDDCERNIGVMPESVRIIQSSRNYAFMSFRSIEDAKCALLGLQGLVLPPVSGWALAVDFNSRNEKQDGMEKNLPPVHSTNKKEEKEYRNRKEIDNTRISPRGSYSPPQPKTKEVISRDGSNIKHQVTTSPFTNNETTPRKSDFPIHRRDSRSPSITSLSNLSSRRSRSPEYSKRSPEPSKQSSSDKSLQQKISSQVYARHSTSKSPISRSRSPEPTSFGNSPAQQRYSTSPKSPQSHSRSCSSTLSSKSRSPSHSPRSSRSRSRSPSKSVDNKRSRSRSHSPKRSITPSSKRYRSSINLDTSKQFMKSMDSMLKAIETLTEKMHPHVVTPPSTPITPKRKYSSNASNTEIPEKQISCQECTRITVLFRQHIESSHTHMEDDTIKDWIKLWFTSRFERATESDPAISTVSYTKLKFLKEELNVFLRSINIEEWNSSTPLYRNWFLPSILGEKLEGPKLKMLVFRIKISNEEAKQRILNSIG